ncbi:serine-rich adhesin for platelets isoform X2 [Drosophila mojavensis]|uniref:serine-rich adhesin for platelets isoform X2 n=1 Tax=Drosophila mojavensis TaxID=7230 RepID=UPI0013EE5B1C|nr:serine-rich adhesin for platelets isoform X2 [Drosophila mojavensis]
MSSGLMSCVRENSPPLELDLSGAGPLSLPEGNSRAHGYQGPTTSTPIACPLAVAEGATVDGNECSTNAEHQQQQQQLQQQQQQQQKRRRFHPLRNLRRIFRRRTITSADTGAAGGAQAGGAGAGSIAAPGSGSCNTLPPPASSSSEKNLRSVALGGGSTAAEAASASSPASPLTHQQLHESYQTQSLPKSKSYGAHRDELLSVLLGKKRGANKHMNSSLEQPVQPPHSHAHNHTNTHTHAQTQSQLHSHSDAMYQTQRPQMGVAVFPDAMSMSRSAYFAEKQRSHHHQRQLRSVGDSSQDLDLAEDIGAAGGAVDMSDSQRSLSEERLLDVDVDGSGYTRETLSQSHDSVFSESATASSLSIVLRAELTDVLRKRRNRPDASDEDLGLPRSPVSPQRHAAAGQSRKVAGYQPREVSSLSLLSVNSTDGEDSSQGHRQHADNGLGSVVLRERQEEDDDVDAVGVERHRLSHAAAKHKMAIRPMKKMPTRQHRRTLETSIPEANEELIKLQLTQAPNPSLRAVKEMDLKTKTRSLPPGSSLSATTTATANSSNNTTNTTSSSRSHSKTIEQKSSTITNISSSSSSSERTTSSSTSTSTSSSQAFGLRALTFKAANALFDGRGESSTDGDDVTTATATTESSEHGFLRRLMQRNSKRSIARANDGLEDVDTSHQNLAKKLQISTSCLEATAREPVPLPSKSRSATSHEQNIQETRQIIKREIHNEGKHGLNALVSNYGVQPQPPTAVKPKSGPAARQRYLPKELGAGLDKPLPTSDSDVTNLLSKSSRGNDTFQSTALVREQAQLRAEASTTHFERKPRIVGLSAFQQKLSRSSDSMGQHSSSSNSLETSTDEPSPLYYEEKQRKTVEKSRSFRNYQEERHVANESAAMHNNMPSLPDLSISFRVPPAYYKQQQQQQLQQQQESPRSPMSPISPNGKCVSLGFEINDNKLLQARAESTGKLASGQAKVSPQRSSTLLVPSPGPANISEIEQNIDLIVKSPMVSLLRKSGAVGEQKSPQRPKVLELKQTTTSSIALGSPGKEAVQCASPVTKSPPSTPSKGAPRNTKNEAEPEFMKIQLNRVDPAQLHSKANHLVLAKNVKLSPATPTERSQSSDDLSMRRLSAESASSIHIVERPTKPLSSANNSPASPAQPSPSISQPAPAELRLAKQQRAASASSLRASYVSSSSSCSCSGGSSELLATPGTPKSSGTRPTAEAVEQEKANGNANRLSLEERKRLFLNEEKSQAERKLTERKKLIGEATPPVTPTTPVTPSGPDASNGNGNGVVLRKKSFASINGNSNANANANANANVNGNANSTGQEDATPELMKVFARRSLKVKDDDVVAMAQVAVANHKKMCNGSQSVDSDKENQSNSEEKLDKLTPNNEPTKLVQSNSHAHGHAHSHTHAQAPGSNRSTVADFRNLNNNNNNNNNNNVQSAPQKLSNLPPIKVSNARNATVNSNNISNISNSNNIGNSSNNKNNINKANNASSKPASERYSLQLKPATTAITTAAAAAAAATIVATDTDATPTKPIERSATVGEFKGIHQRRAEWEQRVKEALK